MIKHERWTDEEYTYLLSIKDNYTYKELADMMTSKFNQRFTPDAVRGKLRYGIQEPVEKPNYKEITEILHDGSHKSDKLLRMSAEQSKDVNYLLQAHGFDTEQWELVSARNNIWNL